MINDLHQQCDQMMIIMLTHLFVERPQEQCNLGCQLWSRPTPVCNRGVVEIQITIVIVVVIIAANLVINFLITIVIFVVIIAAIQISLVINLTCFFSSFLLSALSPLGLKRSRMVSPEGDHDDCDGDGVGEDDHNIWSPGWGLCRSRFGETSSAQCTAQNLIQSSSWEGWPMTMMIHGMTIWWNLDI